MADGPLALKPDAARLLAARLPSPPLEVEDLITLREALDDAIDHRLPATSCSACTIAPEGVCVEHEDDVAQAVKYKHLLERFGGEVR